MYVSLLNRIFNWAVNWKLIMLALKTDLVLALVWNSVWKIATTFGIFGGFARLEKKKLFECFCFASFVLLLFFVFFNENKMFDQTKRKEMENKQVSWEKAKNDQKKKKKQRMRKWPYTTKLLNHKWVSWRRLVQSFRAIDKILNIKVLCQTGQSKLSLAF